MGKITSGSSGVFDGAGIARIGDGIEVTAAELASALGSPAGNPQNTSLNIDGTTSNPFFNSDGTLKPGIPGTAMIGVNAAPAPGLSNTHVTLQDLINVTGSAGLTRGGTLEATVDGVSVAGGIVLMRVEDDDEAQLNFYDFDGVILYANNFLADTNYLGLVWNSSGKPTVEIRTSYDWNKNAEVPLGTVSNLGGTLEVLNAPHRLNNAVTNIIERFDATNPAIRDESVGGLMISESSGRLINVTAGKIWARLNDWSHGAKSGATLIGTYWNGSELAFNSSSQWDNLRYNNAGTLATLDDAKFATLWFFMHAESGAVFCAYGVAQHSTAYLAALELMPEYLPQSFKNQTVFLGRLVFLKGEPSAATIDSPFDGFIHTTLSGGGGGGAPTDTDSVPEGATNLYFTNTRAQNAVVVQTINNGDTTHSPSSNVVFDALALKSDTTHTHAATDITSGVFPDARLSSNVPLKNALNTFTANNTFASGRTSFGPSWFLAIEAATANGAAPRIQSYNSQPLYINESGNAVVIGAGGLQVGTSITVNGNAVWHLGNDGAGSGSDADLLDGQHGSYYLNASNLNAGTVPTARLGSGTANTATYLRGDGAWVPIPPADLSSTANSTVVQIDSASGTDVTILSANNTTAGVMAATDKAKLDAIPAGGAVNISHTANASHVTVNSSTGTGTSIATANSTVAGVLTSTDKSKLDGIAAGAQVNVPADLSLSSNATTVSVNSSSGTDVVILAANSTVAGVMSAADNARLANTSGTNTGDQTTITGNAGSATVLQTPRSIALTGIVVGTATTFDGSTNISIPVTSVNLGNANNTGTVATARLGSGTANSSTILFGNNVWATIPVQSGTTNLSRSADASTVTVISDTGSDVSLISANSSTAGITTAADFARLANTSGTNTGDQTTITGNAGSATVLQTARTIAITGAITGTATSFNGSANISIPVTAIDLTSTAFSGVIGTDHIGAGTANTSTWLRGDGSWQTLPGTGGATNLTQSANATTVTVISDTGTDAIVLAANSTVAGVLSAADWQFFAAGGGGSGATNLTLSSNSTSVTVQSDTGSDAIIPAANSTVAGVFAVSDYNRLVNTSGTNTGDQTTITGNAGTATTLQTARTISLSGIVTGSATSFNGSANISIPVTSVDLGSANNTGTIQIGRLGTGGTANTLTFLRGDNTWAQITGGVIWVTVTSASVNPANNNYGYIMETGGVARSVTLPSPAPAGFYLIVNANGGDVTIISNGNIIDEVGAGNDLLLNDGDTVAMVAKSTGFMEILYGRGTLDLSLSSNATHVGIIADTGTDVYIPAANSTVAGVMSAADHSRLAATSGTNTGDQTSVTGNAGTATTLQTARTIALTGIVVGTATSFDGSSNISIPVTSVNLGNANNTGTVATARLGSGTANSTTVLFGNNVWSTLPVQTGTTNLSRSADASTVTVISDTGTDVALISANSSVAGITTAADFARLANTSGTNTGDQTTITGNAGTATTLQTARTIAISGAITGTATSFNGGANISIPVTAVDLTSATMSGLLGTDHLGSGTANTTTWLRGDNTWQTLPTQTGTTNLSVTSNTSVVTILSDTGTDAFITSANSTVAGVLSAADWVAFSSGGGVTNLTLSSNATTVTVLSDTGTDAVVLSANSTVAGVLSAADYNRLATTSGTNTGDQTTITGNAGTATTLQTARTIALSGVVTGSATSFNGSTNITIPVTAIDFGSANNTGTVAAARLGSGVANSSTYLAGDNTWKTVSGGGGGSALVWVTITSADVASANNNYGYVMETGGTARTVTLPASVPQGFYVVVNASGGDVTVVSNGNVIDQVGSGNDLLLNDGDTVALVGKATGQLEIIYGRPSTAGPISQDAGLYHLIPGVLANKAGSLTTTAVTQVALDTYDATYRSAKYIVQVVDAVSGHSEITEVMITVDNSNNVFVTEFGINYTGAGALAAFTADYSTPNKRLLVTPASTNSTQFKFSATLFEA